MPHGFRLEIENIALLTEEQCKELLRLLGVLAVSTRRLFDDPIQVTEQRMIAHYSHELRAQETMQHLCRYLQQISMDGAVKLTLHPARWERAAECDVPPDH